MAGPSSSSGPRAGDRRPILQSARHRTPGTGRTPPTREHASAYGPTAAGCACVGVAAGRRRRRVSKSPHGDDQGGGRPGRPAGVPRRTRAGAGAVFPAPLAPTAGCRYPHHRAAGPHPPCARSSRAPLPPGRECPSLASEWLPFGEPTCPPHATGLLQVLEAGRDKALHSEARGIPANGCALPHDDKAPAGKERGFGSRKGNGWGQNGKITPRYEPA